MSTFSGDQLAQVNNPDPFAPPVWRSPVYHTPGWVIAIIQLGRLVCAILGFLLRHPVADLVAAVVVVAWLNLGWPGPVLLAVAVLAALALWRWRWPVSFSRFIARPALGKWRRWNYQRHWAAVMTIGRLAPVYRGRLLLPVLGKVSSTRYTDRVAVRLVSGQSAADFAARAENLAHGFAAVTVPGPHRPPRRHRSGAGPPRRPGRDHPRPAAPASGGPARRCRSAAARTARRGWSGCTAPTCCSRARPARGRHRCCGRWSAPCCPPSGRAWCGSWPLTRR